MLKEKLFVNKNVTLGKNILQNLRQKKHRQQIRNARKDKGSFPGLKEMIPDGNSNANKDMNSIRNNK